MRQSTLFSKTLKNLPQNEQSNSAGILVQAGFIDKLFAGAYSILPLGWRVVKKIENIIREEIDGIDGQEILMPVLHPLENYKKTGRDKIDVLFYTELKNKMKLVLGQSNEEVVTPLMKKHITSYRDLPKAVYQFHVKFRNELRAKSGIIRTREFIMKDLYSFHKDGKDLDKYYELVKKTYFKIFKRCGIEKETYYTYASGGTFSKYSHEFQAISPTGEDIIYICKNCNLAINNEIKNKIKKCPNCGKSNFEKKKSIEVGNIFKLGVKFSNSFDFRFTDEKAQKKDVVMGCYGIGLGRLMGTIAEINNDEDGIIWPEAVSPFKVHLLELNSEKEAEKIYKTLKQNQIETLFDDRQDKSAGEKFADADLIGIPYRIVVSKKTLEKQSVEIKKRKSKKIELVKISELPQKLKN
jgi:prolyl-tRNA synthetase